MYGITAQDVYGATGLTAGQQAAAVASSGLKVAAGASFGGLRLAGEAAGNVALRDDPVLWIVAVVAVTVALAWISAH
jgi:hypothetical protein